MANSKNLTAEVIDLCTPPVSYTLAEKKWPGQKPRRLRSPSPSACRSRSRSRSRSPLPQASLEGCKHNNEKRTGSKCKTVFIEQKGRVVDSDRKAAACTINCGGVMGKGNAKDFKDACPQLFQDNKRRCSRKEVKLGQPYLYVCNIKSHRHKWRAAICVPTVQTWRHNARLADVQNGLHNIRALMLQHGIRDLALPALGCSHGGLDYYRVVKPLILDILGNMDATIDLHVPQH